MSEQVLLRDLVTIPERVHAGDLVLALSQDLVAGRVHAIVRWPRAVPRSWALRGVRHVAVRHRWR
jgi:hypothetical protein